MKPDTKYWDICLLLPSKSIFHIHTNAVFSLQHCLSTFLCHSIYHHRIMGPEVLYALFRPGYMSEWKLEMHLSFYNQSLFMQPPHTNPTAWWPQDQHVTWAQVRIHSQTVHWVTNVSFVSVRDAPPSDGNPGADCPAELHTPHKNAKLQNLPGQNSPEPTGPKRKDHEPAAQVDSSLTL